MTSTPSLRRSLLSLRVIGNAKALRIDLHRIDVVGGSADGNLAASLCRNFALYGAPPSRFSFFFSRFLASLGTPSSPTDLPMPPTQIETAEFDPTRDDDGSSYASCLASVGDPLCVRLANCASPSPTFQIDVLNEVAIQSRTPPPRILMYWDASSLTYAARSRSK